MKKILLSLLTIALVTVVAVGATRAYFSDTQSSINNTFTAGTLDLQLANVTGGWSNDVSSTWSSPANWAPGDTVTSSIYLRNVGSIPAMAVYAHWNNLVDPNGMSNYIEVTWLSDSTDIGTNNVSAFVARYDAIANGGNNDGKLSLAELVHGVGSTATPAPNQARFYADANESYVTPVLPANGGTFEIKLGYKFMENAGNDLQGKSTSFDLTLQAAQHPYNH